MDVTPSFLRKPKRSNYDAFKFTKAISKGTKTFTRKNPYDPIIKDGIPFDEGSAQSAILDYLLLEMALGHLFVQRINNTPIYDSKTGKYRSMSKGVNSGFPDILVIKKGRIIFCEVKSSTGQQSKDQVETQQLLENQNAEYYVVRTVKAVQEILKNNI